MHRAVGVDRHALHVVLCRERLPRRTRYALCPCRGVSGEKRCADACGALCPRIAALQRLLDFFADAAAVFAEQFLQFFRHLPSLLFSLPLL